MRMKVAYITIGSRGDSQPHIALAVELVRAGHEVRLWIAPEYLPLVPKVEGLSVLCRRRTVAAYMETMAPIIATGKMDVVLKAGFAMDSEFFAEDADSVKSMCEGWAEIVIFNAPAGHVGLAVAEALNIKALILHVAPLLPTRELFVFNGNIEVPRFMYMFFWWLLYSKLAFPDVLKRAIAEWKAVNGCKLPPLNPFDIVYRINIPAILGFSPASFTPPEDWKHFDYAVTGDWVLSADDLPGEEPAVALVEFIKAGKEPPLYIGWGSMGHVSGQYMTELAVRTLKTIGKRGIVFEGKYSPISLYL